MPDWTPQEGVYPGQSINHVILTPGPSGLVTVSETVGGGMTSAAETLFVSSDDGKSFVQRHPTGDGCVQCYWTSVTFSTPKLGVVISGNSTKFIDVLHTSDGGTTWSLAAVTGLPAVADYELGDAFMIGADIEVPVSIYTHDGNSPPTLSLLISHDGGATFAPGGIALPSDRIWGGFDSLGQVTWVVGDAANIYETTNGGQTWTSVNVDGLQTASTGWISELHVTGPTSAIAVIEQDGCASFKTDCWNQSWLMGTTDGGRTWTDLQN
jgi:photosystem II stability/assembly factor-like uncharacterized protein